MYENEEQDIYEILRDAENKLYRRKILKRNSIHNSILASLTETLYTKSKETERHTERVLYYSLEIGKALKLNQATLDELALVAKLHDIGKIGIEEEILNKPGKLTEDEYAIMRTHSEKGYRLAMLLPQLGHIARGILTHHERWDGHGYPLGLSGEDIPLTARIIAVADAYDAMTSVRFYKKGITKEQAIEELLNCSGTQFDAKVVAAFVEALKKIDKENPLLL